MVVVLVQMARMTSELIARIEAAPSELSSSLCSMRLCVEGAEERMKHSLGAAGAADAGAGVAHRWKELGVGAL